MLLVIIRYFAKKTKNVQAQVLLATFYGLLSLYGVGGTVPIILKMRKHALSIAKKGKK